MSFGPGRECIWPDSGEIAKVRAMVSSVDADFQVFAAPIAIILKSSGERNIIGSAPDGKMRSHNLKRLPTVDRIVSPPTRLFPTMPRL